MYRSFNLKAKPMHYVNNFHMNISCTMFLIISGYTVCVLLFLCQLLKHFLWPNIFKEYLCIDLFDKREINALYKIISIETLPLPYSSLYTDTHILPLLPQSLIFLVRGGGIAGASYLRPCVEIKRNHCTQKIKFCRNLANTIILIINGYTARLYCYSSGH